MEAGSFEGAGFYEIDYMPVAAKDVLKNMSVRAVYVDKTTGEQFHSRIAEVKSVDSGIELIAPREVKKADGQYICSRVGSTGREYYCINAPRIPFEMPQEPVLPDGTPMAYYADFTFEDATLNYSTHDAAVLNQYNPYIASSFVDYGENWSDQIVNDGNLGLMIHRELRESELKDETVSGQIHAVYPFLISPDTKFTPVSPAAVASRAADVAEPELDVDHLSLAMMPASAPANVAVRADAYITTGIETVGMDGNASVEYYNLQGIRILNPVAGDYYIRRCGNSIDKIRF